MRDAKVANKEVASLKSGSESWDMSGVVSLTFRSFDRHTMYKHQVTVGHLAHDACGFKKRLEEIEEEEEC